MKTSWRGWALPCALCGAAASCATVYGEDATSSPGRAASYVESSQEAPAPDANPAGALAESIVIREETSSGRRFDPDFRARVKRGLQALPLPVLETHAQGGRGLVPHTLGDSAADLLYTPLTPCRIIDTRLAGGPVVPGATRNFLVTGTDLSAQGGSATGCNVPTFSTAAMVNFVAVNAAGAGDLRVAPYGSAMPLASTINYAAVPGLNIANGVVVALCDPSATTCSADLAVQADVSATHLVADVQGYFRDVEGNVGVAVGSAAVPPAGMAAAPIISAFYTARSFGNVLVRARGSCTMGPAGAGGDDAIELAIGQGATDAFNTPSGEWGVVRIPVNSGAFQLSFSVDRIWPTARRSIYPLSLFGRHAVGLQSSDTCSGSMTFEREF